MLRLSSVLLFIACATVVSCSPLANRTVLVFGDSWGTTLWKAVQTMFNRHGGGWNVKSSAVGGTTACQWAGHPTSLSDEAKSLFGAKGPDFVWYTLGGNDIGSGTYQRCLNEAKTQAAIEKCNDAEVAVIQKCTDTLMDDFLPKFPNAKVMQCFYDLPCEEGSCIPASRAQYCGTNRTCMNEGQLELQTKLVDATAAKYPDRFTSINIIGTLQKAAGVPGAEVGKPVLDQGSRCDWMSGCVHPHGTVAQAAVTDEFWNLYFSKQ